MLIMLSVSYWFTLHPSVFNATLIINAPPFFRISYIVYREEKRI